MYAVSLMKIYNLTANLHKIHTNEKEIVKKITLRTYLSQCFSYQ